MIDDDADLERRFRALRREDLENVPPFQRVWKAAREGRRPRRHVAAWATALAAVVLILAVLWLPRASIETPARDAAIPIVEWRSPTDFLLDTPGRALLATVPTIGGLSAPASGLLRSTPTPSPATKGEMS